MVYSLKRISSSQKHWSAKLCSDSYAEAHGNFLSIAVVFPFFYKQMVPGSIFTRSSQSQQLWSQSSSYTVTKWRRSPGEVWFALSAEEAVEKDPHRWWKLDRTGSLLFQEYLEIDGSSERAVTLRVRGFWWPWCEGANALGICRSSRGTWKAKTFPLFGSILQGRGKWQLLQGWYGWGHDNCSSSPGQGCSTSKWNGYNMEKLRRRSRPKRLGSRSLSECEGNGSTHFLLLWMLSYKLWVCITDL